MSVVLETSVVLRNNFDEYFVAGCDARLGVGFYAFASASRRVASSLKILLA